MVWLKVCWVALAIFARARATAGLNVHIVPHTHDDPGWLKTVDECYTGSNSSIQRTTVQYILDTVVSHLLEDPSKTFIYAEQSFFMRWWSQQTQSTREAVKKLVSNGQLEFVNGGWVMHDEAASHYVSMIDQTTLGHRFIKEIFGVTPKIGWQIDPFGHSSTQAYLLSNQVGFDALYFGRIDYEDHAKRMEEKTLEMVWRASASLTHAQVFTGAFQSGNYGPPSGFCYDQLCSDDPIQDDPALEDYNVPEVVEKFVAACYDMASHAVGSNIMMTMGSDFHYQNAHSWYKNLDKLMKYVNEDGRVNVFYSTPSRYTAAKNDEEIEWTVKTDDFFPYADCSHCYWTGYFTSRPTLKYLERYASSYLQATKQLQVLASQFSSIRKNPEQSLSKYLRDANGAVDETIFALTAAVGLTNHHDAITGTSKQHVAYDYIKILDKALSNAEKSVSHWVSKLAFTPTLEGTAEVPELKQCRLMNESVCDATQSVTSGSIAVVVYNALPRASTQVVTVLLSLASAAVVTDKGEPIFSQVYETPSSPAGNSAGTFTLVFSAENVPALGFSRFAVFVSPPPGFLQMATYAPVVPASELIRDSQQEAYVFTNGPLSISFSKHDNKLRQITNAATGVTIPVRFGLYYYTGYGSPGSVYSEPINVDGSNSADAERKLEHQIRMGGPTVMKHSRYSYGLRGGDTQASGAYIFRPGSSDEPATPIEDAGEIVLVTSGPIVTEIRQKFGDFVNVTYRLKSSSPLLEIEWTVGPVPIDDNIGKEVIARLDTDLETDGRFFTDSNGREFLERQRDYRPTWDLTVTEQIAGNYYPVTVGAYVKDSNGITLGVLTDRAQAMGSIADGSLEVMLHRRLLVDDSRGVGEALNETTEGITAYPNPVRAGDGITVRGSLYLSAGEGDSAIEEIRKSIDNIYRPLLVTYGGDEAVSAFKHSKSEAASLGQDLPPNVNLLTLEAWSASPPTILVRLAHQFSVSESESMSVPVTLDLQTLLSPLGTITSVTEMSLSANQVLGDMQSSQMTWLTSSGANEPMPRAVDGDSSTTVTLSPMQIGTYLVQL